MGSGKHRWKISIYRSKPESTKKEPPDEFICPISSSLMSDPVIVSSGQTFERVCVQACKTLNFSPTLRDGSVPDFSVVIPNLALKSAIQNWLSGASTYRSPKPTDLNSALKLVRSMMSSQQQQQRKGFSEEMLLRQVGDNPDASKNIVGHAASELNRRVARFGSDEWGESNNSAMATPLQFSTRPSCFSSSSSVSTAADVDVAGAGHTSEEEDELVAKMRSLQTTEQEEAVLSLRRTTRTSVDSRLSLCTLRVVSCLRALIVSRHAGVQVNALAAVVNLSLEKVNKVKIVRSGMVPPLIDALKNGSPESLEHASGALFSLALDDSNKTAIGVLGALPPLIQTMTSATSSDVSDRARHDAALALYHLSLVQSNRSKLVKLGSVPVLVGMARAGRMTGRVLLILCNLGACAEGRAAMLDAGAVECLVGMLRVGEFEAESDRENCAAAVFVLSRGGGVRFRVVAAAAGAAEVMRGVAEAAGGASERAREKARRVLEALRAREEEEAEEEEVDWEKVLEAGFPSRSFSRIGGVSGNNSTGF